MRKKNENIFVYAAASIRIISSVFNNSAIPAFDESFNWKEFAEFCSNHKILNIVAYCLKDSNIRIPEDVKNYFSDTLLHSMLKEAQRDVEIEQLSDDFEKKCIPHMLMKGYVIKSLYPQPFLRTMGDVDILVGEKLQEASDVILNNGFRLKGEAFLHDIFVKDKSIVVELHKSLIDESLKTYYDYFGVGFDKAHICDGFNYKYELNIEDFYIFLITHMAKHYEICGTGIRSVCDIYIYNRFYGEKLDRDYISAELSKIGLKNFEEKIKSLSVEWFSGNFSGDFDAVGEYLVSDGVFGSIDNHELNAYLLSENESKGKYRYYLRCVFPNYKYMCARYGILKKCPFLLPLYWLIRIFSTLFKSKGSIRYRLKGVAMSGEDDIDRFKETGLK